MRLMLEAHSSIFCYDETFSYEILRSRQLMIPAKSGVTHIGFKIPRWTEQLATPTIVDPIEFEGGRQFYNQDPIIFLLRDVRDVVASMKTLKFGDDSWIEKWGRRILNYKIEQDALFRIRFANEIAQLYASEESPASVGALYWKYKTLALFEYNRIGFPVLPISYEFLVTDTTNIMTIVLRFLDLPWDGAVLKHQHTAHAETGQDGMTLGGTDSCRPVDSRAINNWQNLLTEMEIKQIDSISGKLNQYISSKATASIDDFLNKIPSYLVG